MREYFVYSPFSKLNGWIKRSAVQPQAIYSEFPQEHSIVWSEWNMGRALKPADESTAAGVQDHKIVIPPRWRLQTGSRIIPHFLQTIPLWNLAARSGNDMKATGIVRRVDDLGRIVIPKEIRRTLRIREGDPLLTSLTERERFVCAIGSLENNTFS